MPVAPQQTDLINQLVVPAAEPAVHRLRMQIAGGTFHKGEGLDDLGRRDLLACLVGGEALKRRKLRSQGAWRQEEGGGGEQPSHNCERDEAHASANLGH